MKWADIKPWVSKLAPMIGTALGGPLGGAAGAMLGSALGIKDATPQSIQDAINNGTLTGDQIAALKIAEQNFQIQMAQMDINSIKDLEALAVDDRKSARDREVAVKDRTPRIMAYGVSLGFFGLLSFLIRREVPEASRDIINMMIGSLGTAWIQIVSFYFGSSAGSARKDEIIGSKK